MAFVNEGLRVVPIAPGGAAAEVMLPRAQRLVVADLTAQPRFGIKGPGSAAWLEGRGFALSVVNRAAHRDGLRLLRLGGEDFLATGSAGEIADLTRAWNDSSGQRGYWSWREEGWAWLRLSGPSIDAVMASLCAVDLRAGRFAQDEIAQTRVAHIEAVVVRAPAGFDIFFDIASTAYFVRAVTIAAHAFDGDLQ